MRLTACQFFQPCSLPTHNSRYTLVTSARDDEYLLEMEDGRIKVIHKLNPLGPATYVTIYNTCWYIEAEVIREPSPSQTDIKGSSKTKSKPRAVVVE